MAVLDNFTGTDGTNLTSHTPSGGGSWSQHSGLGGNMVITDANRARVSSNSNEARYLHSHTPSSADYTVKGDLHFVTTISGFPKLFARADASANTAYFVQYNGGGVRWELYKIVAGTQTQLGTNFTDIPNNGDTRAVELDVSGTTVTLKIDGTNRCGSPHTDSAISAAGKVGVGGFFSTAPSNATGMHWDNVEIVESVGGGGSAIAVISAGYAARGVNR